MYMLKSNSFKSNPADYQKKEENEQSAIHSLSNKQEFFINNLYKSTTKTNQLEEFLMIEEFMKVEKEHSGSHHQSLLMNSDCSW